MSEKKFFSIFLPERSDTKKKRTQVQIYTVAKMFFSIKMRTFTVVLHYNEAIRTFTVLLYYNEAIGTFTVVWCDELGGIGDEFETEKLGEDEEETRGSVSETDDI